MWGVVARKAGAAARMAGSSLLLGFSGCAHGRGRLLERERMAGARLQRVRGQLLAWARMVKVA
jgi:hypothetical protein